MCRALLVLTILAVAASAVAAPKPKPADDALAAYRKALRAGRKAENKGDLPGAAASFGQALAAKPKDGVAQMELGWVAFQRKDLAQSEALARAAIAVLGDGHQLGGAWYNLGRTLEAKGDKPGAIAAYKTSLEKRPNHVVRERLATLDPAAAAAADAATPTALQGPFDTFAAACAALASEGEGEAETDVLESLAKPAGPWRAARAVVHGAQRGLALVVQTDVGWFVTPDFDDCDFEGLHERCTVEAIEAVNLVGGPERELRFAYVGSMEYRMDVDGDDGQQLHPMVSDDTHAIVVCGVGKSAIPSCSGQLVVAVSSNGGDVMPRMEFTFDPVFSGDQLEIKPKSGKAASDYKDVLGVHKIVFP